MAVRLLLVVTIVLSTIQSAIAIEWIRLYPNPSYSRDLAMGASTIALAYAPQSESRNPAGLGLLTPASRRVALLFFNPAGVYQIHRYFEGEHEGRTKRTQSLDAARLVVSGAALRHRFFSLSLLLSRPVMVSGESSPYPEYARSSSLQSHQNSVQGTLNVHPRVSLGGRIDRYYEYSKALAEGYSYGAILRPRGISFGIQYQRFPAGGNRVAHPLDRRADGTTSAGLALERGPFAFSSQVMNLTERNKLAYLEPHGGIEWRPARVLSLRAGGTQFSRSPRWAWTAGVGLLDANWFRPKRARFSTPDEVIQAAIAVIYRHRVPETGIMSLTCAWRW